MFLGAGSVMHAMDDEVDMRHYGALRRMLPVTFLTFAMGYLAIIGFPGFSGFWSKDKIIETALAENWLVGLLAMLGAGITGFYMTRLMLMTFFTDQRWPRDAHPHESPKVMTVPLIVLAALSVLGGVMLIGDWIVDFLAPVVGTPVHADPPVPALRRHAHDRRRRGRRRRHRLVPGRQAPGPEDGAPGRLVRDPRGPRRPVRRRDQRRARRRARPPPGQRAAHASDKYGVDGVLTGGPVAVGALAGQLRKVQNGFVRTYALSLLGGVLLVVLALLAVNLA